MLSRERVNLMTSISTSNKKLLSGHLFKGKGVRVKLNPPAESSIQWVEKGSHREDSVLTFISNLKGQPVQICSARRCIYLFDNHFAHVCDDVKKAFCNKAYLLRIILAGITGDVQGSDMDFHHPVKTYYRTLEMELMLKKLRQNPKSIPSPSRDEMIKILDASWSKIVYALKLMRIHYDNLTF